MKTDIKQILELMKERAEILRKAIAAAERDEGTFPEGSLRVSSANGRIRFYKMTEKGDTQGEYIKKDNMSLISALAQKDYNRQFQKTVRYELARTERIIRRLNDHNADSVYNDLSDIRKTFVTPYILTDELYAKEWQEKSFKPNPYMPEKKIYDTRKGEKVRSKSEAILADILYELGIPYHYEKPMHLSAGKVRYPDFTLLKVRSREEIFLEHFGLLDDEEYRNGSLQKLEEYRKHGVFICFCT
jgi:hypothetical protein